MVMAASVSRIPVPLLVGFIDAPVLLPQGDQNNPNMMTARHLPHDILVIPYPMR